MWLINYSSNIPYAILLGLAGGSIVQIYASMIARS